MIVIGAIEIAAIKIASVAALLRNDSFFHIEQCSSAVEILAMTAAQHAADWNNYTSTLSFLLTT
jgi:hypothetical protein